MKNEEKAEAINYLIVTAEKERSRVFIKVSAIIAETIDLDTRKILLNCTKELLNPVKFAPNESWPKIENEI